MLPGGQCRRVLPADFPLRPGFPNQGCIPPGAQQYDWKDSVAVFASDEWKVGSLTLFYCCSTTSILNVLNTEIRLVSLCRYQKSLLCRTGRQWPPNFRFQGFYNLQKTEYNLKFWNLRATLHLLNQVPCLSRGLYTAWSFELTPLLTLPFWRCVKATFWNTFGFSKFYSFTRHKNKRNNFKSVINRLKLTSVSSAANVRVVKHQM